jgi:nicotinamidase/pyrazinamidase
MKALILVDIQNDFCPGGALAVPKGDEVVAVANRLIPRFPLVVATQDWHPADHGSFAANHPGAAPYQMSELSGLPQVLWPVHCVQDTAGAAFHPALDRKAIRRIFPKGTDATVDSYSGFFDNGRRKGTGLGEYLKAEQVDEVAVLGLATDYCVKATVLDALGLGLKVTLVSDGCRAVDIQAGDGERAIAEMSKAGAKVCTSQELQ